MTDKGQAANQPVTQDVHEEGVSITEYLLILLDEWRTLVVPLVAVVVFTVFYALSMVPEYEAHGVIQVSSSDPGASGELLQLVGVDRPSMVDTEVEILRSKRIATKAIKDLSLNVAPIMKSWTFDLDVSLRGKSPLPEEVRELRKTIKGLSISDDIEQAVGAKISAEEDGSLAVRLGGGAEKVIVKKGGRFDRNGVSFNVGETNMLASVGEISVQLLPDDLAAESFSARLRVARVAGGRTDTNLARISFENPDRVVARDLVNAVMDAYMSFALEWRTLRADRSASFIEGQLEVLRSNLGQSEKEYQKFVEKNGAVLLPEQAKELIRNGANLDLELQKVQIQEELLSTVVSDLTRASALRRPARLTGDFLFDDELLGKAIGVLNDLEFKREALLAEVTEAHPTTIRMGEEIDRVQAHILKLVRASRERINERRKAIARILGEMQTELSSFPDKERQMVGLKRKVEVSQDLYRFLMTKLEESRILKASTTTDKRIIDRATTPFRKSKPRRTATVMTSVFIGLLLGVVAVFMRRAIDPRIRDEEEAKTLSGLPVYGAVPDLREVGIAYRDSPVLDAVWEAPKGPAAEAFRTIRTNVEFAQVGDEPIKVLQITSSEASEGKSTVIANLGVALANVGHKALIVDLDLRRPSQHAVWGVSRSPGISEHLVGRTGVPLRRIDGWDIDVVPAGSEPPESQRLLSSKRLAELMDKWREEYDYILLDTPPLLVADSLVISKLSDMVIFIVRPRHCRRANLRLAKMTHDKMNLAKGLVINGVTTRRGGYYHYYRGSYYGSRTSDTQES